MLKYYGTSISNMIPVSKQGKGKLTYLKYELIPLLVSVAVHNADKQMLW